MATDACTSVASLSHVTPLLTERPRRGYSPRALDFAKQARCAELDGERVLALLYSIDSSHKRLDLTVEALTLGKETVPTAIILMDEKGQSMHRVGFDAFVRRGQAYTKHLIIDTDSVTYLAIALDPRFKDGALQQTNAVQAPIPLIGPGGAVMIANGTEQKRNMPLGTRGKVRVHAEPKAQVMVEDL